MSITSLLRAGAGAAVRGFAVEAVRGLSPGVTPSLRSPLSRAVQKIRLEFNLPNTPSAYEMARNIFRRAVRSVQRADRESAAQSQRIDSGLPPSPSPRPGSLPRANVRYTVFVELESGRSSRTYRGQVSVIAPLNTPHADIAAMARQAVIDRQVASQSVRGSANYGQQFGPTWQVSRYEVNSIEDIE